ncbi:hypothetical protein RND81_08G190700 [Saponaria officinalis]|uniref:F-box domain-containing protein n=1 Tax=Saponaria officinalis TaxID=3572 RepID=A0AAW1JAF3_SAPOF
MEEDKYKPPSVSEAPWLIIGHENYRRIEKQTFCTMSPLLSNNKSYTKTIVELDGKCILASSLGWLIIWDRFDPTIYSLWNPATLQSKILPPLQDAPNNEEQQPVCVLTSAPNDDIESNNNSFCVLLVFFLNQVFSCRPFDRDCKWVKQSIEHDGENMIIMKAITCNDYIYAYAYNYIFDVDDRRELFVRMKVVDDNSNSILFEPCFLEPPQNTVNYKICRVGLDYLVEVCGVVYAVYVMPRQCDHMSDYDIHKVIVWRLDLRQLKWILVESFGDRAFLLGDSSSTWCEASTSQTDAPGFQIEGDCIYLARSNCQTVHLYRLRDDSYTFLLPHPYFCRSYIGPTWFMPHNRPGPGPGPSPSLSAMVEQDKIENTCDEMKHGEDVREDQMDILSELPEDILTSIANRLHLFDYMNLRATGKKFHTVIPKPKWRQGCPSPLLLSLKDNKGKGELWDIFENRTLIVKTPHYSPEQISTIELCQGGCLLMRVGVESLQYFDLFTGAKWEYPYCPDIYIWGYACSTTPSSSDCLTIGISGYGFSFDIWCFQAASGEWECHSFKGNQDEDVGLLLNFNSSARYYNGAFYFIGVKGNIAVFKIVEGKSSWKVYHSPLTEEEQELVNSCYIVELDGQLVSVIFQEVGKKVQIFKFDILEEHWVELNDLGEHVLFLSPPLSFSVMENDRNMRNRIYLSKRMDNNIVYYSLDTGKYHIRQKRCN